jgi:site-specific DNA-cytosine methylase
MTMKHVSIIPLIGGMPIGSERAYGSPPDALVSWSPFAANETHLVEWYRQRDLDVPYYQVDVMPPRLGFKPDVVESTCPCAGLSMLNVKASSDSSTNDWMVNTAEYVLGEWAPRVYWGENAPGLMGGLGDGVRDRLHKVAHKHGYSVGYYKTKSLLHGVPQVRNRAFYFFWKEDPVVLEWFRRPHQRIEDLITGVKSNSQREPINKKKPSDEPYYRYVLEVIEGGISHRDYVKKAAALPVRSNDSKSIIEKSGHTYLQVADWFDAQGLEKLADKTRSIHEKLAGGGSIMKRDTIIPKDYIGAFVGHYPHMLAHPVEDRYIDYREAMTIMGLPDDFELVGAGPKTINHVCQNVPVQTAADLASEVLAGLNGERARAQGGIVYQSNVNRTVEYEHARESQAALTEYF